jgi:RHS repeat-associated protein
MVSVPGGTYSYDAQNRLVSATVNGLTTEFTYDSRNRVVRRVSPTGTLNLTYSGWNLIEERNGGGELEQTYLHGAGVDEMLVKVSSSGPAYYHHDGLGSTVALTGENGELLESYRYDAFGGVTVYGSSGSALPASPRGNRFLFTGREWLGQAGIYDYRNRVYSASLGRFLQTDPIRFEAGDANIYRYVGNSAVNWRDPLGLWQLTVTGAAIVGTQVRVAYNPVTRQLSVTQSIGVGLGGSIQFNTGNPSLGNGFDHSVSSSISGGIPLIGNGSISSETTSCGNTVSLTGNGPGGISARTSINNAGDINTTFGVRFFSLPSSFNGGLSGFTGFGFSFSGIIR